MDCPATVVLMEPTFEQVARVRPRLHRPSITRGRSEERSDSVNSVEEICTFDLEYDPNEVGGDMVVECRISHGPRADDVAFDPQPGDWLLVGDHEEEPRRARVVRREANRLWMQLNLPGTTQAVA